MATNKKIDDPPKTWEILGAIFGYFAIAKDVPAVLKILKVAKPFPNSFKEYLLSVNPSQEFWYLLAFTMLLLSIFWVLLLRGKLLLEPKEEMDDEKEALKGLRKIQIIGHVKSLGLSIIRNLILDALRVDFYGTFRRPSTWEPRQGYYNWIDRITYNSGHGFEFQYSTNFKEISFREHTCNNETYGKSDERKPTWREVGLLFIASNFFFFWFIPHFFTRLNKGIYIVIVIAASVALVLYYLSKTTI